MNTKLEWGLTMTFLPILFKREIVESIFYNLIGMNIPEHLLPEHQTLNKRDKELISPCYGKYRLLH